MRSATRSLGLRCRRRNGAASPNWEQKRDWTAKTLRSSGIAAGSIAKSPIACDDAGKEEYDRRTREESPDRQRDPRGAQDDEPVPVSPPAEGQCIGCFGANPGPERAALDARRGWRRSVKLEQRRALSAKPLR